MSIHRILNAKRTGEPPQMTKEELAAFRQGVLAARLGQEPDATWTPEQRAGWLCHASVMVTLPELWEAAVCAN